MVTIILNHHNHNNNNKNNNLVIKIIRHFNAIINKISKPKLVRKEREIEREEMSIKRKKKRKENNNNNNNNKKKGRKKKKPPVFEEYPKQEGLGKHWPFASPIACIFLVVGWW